LVGGRVVFKECYVCPKVHQVWEKDRSQLILDAVVVAAIPITNRNQFVRLVGMVLQQKLENIVGTKEIDLCINANLIFFLEIPKSLVPEEVMVFDVRYHRDCRTSKFSFCINDI